MVQEHKMKNNTNKNSVPAYSLYPELHSRVIDNIDKRMENIKFRTKDHNLGCESKTTNLVGNFRCSNPKCNKKWSSGVVATVVRLYNNNTYNAKVYHQRCKRCEWRSRPVLDDSYEERVCRNLQIMQGIFSPRIVQRRDKATAPHDENRCEGCKDGVCLRRALY